MPKHPLQTRTDMQELRARIHALEHVRDEIKESVQTYRRKLALCEQRIMELEEERDHWRMLSRKDLDGPDPIIEWSETCEDSD